MINVLDPANKSLTNWSCVRILLDRWLLLRLQQLYDTQLSFLIVPRLGVSILLFAVGL
jgi:hypothetical protein